MNETKCLIGWICRYCGTENQTEAGTIPCKKCGNEHDVSLNGEVRKLLPNTPKDDRKHEVSLNGEVRKLGQTATLSNIPEKTLETIAQIVLWIGILAGIILFFIGVTSFNETRNAWGQVQQTTGWAQLFMSVWVILISVTSWAFLRVIANISNSLKEINQKTK